MVLRQPDFLIHCLFLGAVTHSSMDYSALCHVIRKFTVTERQQLPFGNLCLLSEAQQAKALVYTSIAIKNDMSNG